VGLLELRNGQMLPIRRIEMPAFAPEYERQARVELEDGFTPQLHARIQELRPAHHGQMALPVTGVEAGPNPRGFGDATW